MKNPSSGVEFLKNCAHFNSSCTHKKKLGNLVELRLMCMVWVLILKINLKFQFVSYSVWNGQLIMCELNRFICKFKKCELQIKWQTY